MAKLKLFTARLGFFDTVVAAPSRKAALAAWGVHQDLFKLGGAEETDDPAAQVALDRPGVVLRRPAGSGEPYAEDAAPKLAVPKGKPAARRKAAPPAPPPKPKPDRAPLDAAERALTAAEAKWAEAAAAFAAEREALDAREMEARAAAEVERRRLAAAVEKARAAFKQAGGEA